MSRSRRHSSFQVSRPRPAAEWVERSEAARLTGLSEAAIVRLGNDGRIRWHNKWGHVLVSLSDARRVVADRIKK